MTAAPVLVLQWSDWLDLFTHYLSLSLMAVGGAATTLPEMHRYLVDQLHWLSEDQFRASIAIAQSSPGPNVLYVILLGWNVGMNAGGVASALLGGLLSATGMLLPSTTFAYLAARWVQRHRELPGVRAFKQGMSPIVISLLLATGWILASAPNELAKDWPLWLLTAATTLIIWRSKVHLLWLLAAGAALGAFNLV